MSGLVVLTAGGDFAERVLLGLALRGVVPEATFIAPLPKSRAPADPARFRRNASPRRFAAAVARRVLKRLDDDAQPEGWQNQWSEFASRWAVMPSVNDPAMESAIREIEPDYLVLAGCGIVRDNILRLPARGTLNVHPGLLPWIRGVSVVERAIERSVPVGVTAHFVNAGIDTGDVIHRELIPVHPGDSLRSLRKKASRRCTQLLVDLSAAAARGDHPSGSLQGTRYPYCKWLTEAQIANIDAQVRGGRACELYESWLDYFGSPVLPAGREDSPPIDSAPMKSGPEVDAPSLST